MIHTLVKFIYNQQLLVSLFLIFSLFLPYKQGLAQTKKDNTSTQAQEQEEEQSPQPKKSKGFFPFTFFKNTDKKIIPVPIIETRPDEGRTYGLMPVMIFSDKNENAIKAILGLIAQYNSISGVGGIALGHFYPKPHQEITFFGGVSQRYFREFTATFFDPYFFDKYYLDIEFSYIKSPFGHFFGIGPSRTKNNQSTFTSRNFSLDITAGYYVLDHLRIDSTFRFHSTDILNRAIEDFDDTLTRYGGLPNVVDSTNLINEVAVVFDNREKREYSHAGFYAKGAYFFSLKSLGSDKTFHGFNLEAIHLLPLLKNRITQAVRFNIQEVYGSRTPFYELSSLGGPDELRSFNPNRFVDQGKIIFQIEQRIRLATMTLMGKTFDINADPFFEFGRVFDSMTNLGFNNWQPVGGLGLRLFVPPNVIGRLDLAVGSDGFEIYTRLGYPF